MKLNECKICKDSKPDGGKYCIVCDKVCNKYNVCPDFDSGEKVKNNNKTIFDEAIRNW